MKDTKTLKLNKDFRRLYYRGKSCVCRNLVLYCMKNRRKENRLGITCAKAVGNAVTRNRAKRLVRESYRLLEAEIPKGYDFVVVVRSAAVGKKLSHISADMAYALRKLSVAANLGKTAENIGR